MKHCEKAKAGQCGFATITPHGCCGYKEKMEEWELCPLITNDWEAYIDKCTEVLHEQSFRSRRHSR